MKRGCEAGSGVGPSGSKVARREEAGRPWELRAGMILEVKLRNFMCHEASPCFFLMQKRVFFNLLAQVGPPNPSVYNVP